MNDWMILVIIICLLLSVVFNLRAIHCMRLTEKFKNHPELFIKRHNRMSDWFYIEPRHEDELLIGTRVESIEHNYNRLHHYGKQGIVVGYRHAKGAIYPTGWHYIRFDDDTAEYPDKSLMPYAHRDYLKVIEKAHHES